MVIKDINGYVRDANGDPVVDENGRFQLLGHPDNIIDDADMELIGTSDPGWLAGMTNTFKYKDFDLSFHLKWNVRPYNGRPYRHGIWNIR